MLKALVCGAGGFIGTHLVSSLKKRGYYVVGADLKYPEHSSSEADKFYQIDLRSKKNVEMLFTYGIDEVYQLAADMGGAGYIFTGDHDADIIHNSSQINLNICEVMRERGVKKVFYTSSACVYPERNQLDPDNPLCEEDSAYPADPDSDYGWEKLFSERLYLSYARNYNFRVRIARLHNVFGPLGAFNNGREKAPAAICRKVFESNGTVEVWGSGNQTRSFLYIDQCIEGIHRIMQGDYGLPLNLGSTNKISINDLVNLVSAIAGKKVEIINVPGPQGVNGRNSDNKLIYQQLAWVPEEKLEYGLRETYKWISEKLTKKV